MSNEDKQGSKQELNDKNNKDDSQNELLINLFKELLKKTLSKEDLLRIFEEIIQEIKTKEEEISKEKVEEKKEEKPEEKLVVKEFEEEISKIPLVFNKELSVFESIVKFLRENKNLRYAKIAKLLNRNPRVIWITYQRAKKKFPYELKPDYSFEIPINVFSSKKHSILESAVKYLREFYGLKFSRISELLKKSYTTVHTAYARSKTKDKNKKEENVD
ncbi:MAG: hypothetical protein QXU20_03625 [Candidatus Woesearchaeota archaeon]